jgi:F0F1-type ATP synthase delta subunit
MQFYHNQFKEISPAIKKCLSFVDNNISEKHQELIRMNSVAVLPFMMTKVLDNPQTETKENYKKIIKFLEYIKYNKGMANHLIASTTTNKKVGSTPNPKRSAKLKRTPTKTEGHPF